MARGPLSLPSIGVALLLLSRAFPATSVACEATAVAGGGGHVVVLASDATVWAWGKNSGGQLGDGTTTYSSLPLPVAGLGGVIAVAAGGYRDALPATVGATPLSPDAETRSFVDRGVMGDGMNWYYAVKGVRPCSGGTGP